MDSGHHTHFLDSGLLIQNEKQRCVYDPIALGIFVNIDALWQAILSKFSSEQI
jgi:hypothetical protein